jgi:K+-transporting ATPase A subunit
VDSGDATDTDATTSFASVNTGTDSGVPGTAGYMEQISITLSNLDNAAAGALVRFSLARATANATDTATGDCYVFSLEVRDSA